MSTLSDVSVQGAPSARVAATPLADAGPVTVAVDAAGDAGMLDRPWRPMIGSEHLSHAVSTDTTGGRVIGEELSAALKAAHDELGVASVRAHGILCDDLGVYREVDGEPVHDFTGVDKVYDHIRSLGLYPVVEISFMPHDLASDPTKTVFDYAAIVSPPKDWDRWHDLVRDLVQHVVDRYGIDEVRRALVLRGLERSEPRGVLVRHARRVAPDVRRHRRRRARGRRPAARRRPVDRRGRLGRGAARPRRGVGRRARLRQHAHLRRPAAGLPAVAGALRPRGHPDLVDRVGRHPDALLRGQRRGVLRGLPAPRDGVRDGPDRGAVLLGRLRPLRGARPPAGAAARRLRPAHHRRAAQAPLVGAVAARAARRPAAARRRHRRRRRLAGGGARDLAPSRAPSRCWRGT